MHFLKIEEGGLLWSRELTGEQGCVCWRGQAAWLCHREGVGSGFPAFAGCDCLSATLISASASWAAQWTSYCQTRDGESDQAPTGGFRILYVRSGFPERQGPQASASDGHLSCLPRTRWEAERLGRPRGGTLCGATGQQEEGRVAPWDKEGNRNPRVPVEERPGQYGAKTAPRHPRPGRQRGDWGGARQGARQPRPPPQQTAAACLCKPLGKVPSAVRIGVQRAG